MNANEIVLVGDENALSVLDAIVVEAQEALRGQIELGMSNADLLKMIDLESLREVRLRMIVLREVNIEIAEVARESLRGIDIKAENQLGTKAET